MMLQNQKNTLELGQGLFQEKQGVWGSDASLKRALPGNFSLIWIKSIKINFWSRGYSTSISHPGLPKCPFVNHSRSFIDAMSPSSRTILFNSFILNNFLIFRNFLFKCFYHIFRISVLYCRRHNSLHAVKLNKYAPSALRRRFSRNRWHQIKTFTNQNFHFSMFSVDAMSSVF